MGKDAPEAPDPVATINAQKDANRLTQYTPNGTVQYGTVGADGNFVPGTGGDAQMETESEFNRLLREGAQSLGIDFASQISPILGSVSSAQDYRNALNEHGASVDGLMSGLPALSTDFAAQAKQAQDAVYQSGMGYLQPEFDTQNRRTEQKLSNQGLPVSGEAYDHEMDRVARSQGQQQNQLAMQAILAGNQRQNELFGQNSQARQQVFGENQTAANFDLSKQGYLSNLEQSQRSAQYNELASLLGLQQVAQYQAVPQVDAAGIIQAGYDTQSKNYQAQQAAFGQAVGGIAQGAGAWAGSDMRLKEGVTKVGEQGGINIYEFNYTGQPDRYRGVMAQEVAHIDGAVRIDDDGFMMVNYDVIGIPFERVA